MRSGKRLFAAVCLLCGLVVILWSRSPALAKEKEKESEGGKPVTAADDSAMQARKHLSFGDRYLKNKQYKDAEAQFTQAWSFDPKNEQVAYYLGKLYNELEQYDDAVTWFKKALEMDPEKNAQNIYYFLSNIYTMQENLTEAISAYEALLGLSSEPDKEILYLHHLVSLHVEEGDYEAALKYARRWGELEPDNAEIQDTIGKLALSTGGEDEALAQMEKGLEMNPEGHATLDKTP